MTYETIQQDLVEAGYSAFKVRGSINQGIVDLARERNVPLSKEQVSETASRVYELMKVRLGPWHDRRK